MKFNYQREKRNFDERWKRLYEEYKKAGMSDDAINKLKDFDWDEVKRERVYCKHNQHFPEEEYKDGSNPVIIKFEEAFTVEDKLFQNDRYGWIEDLDDDKIINVIKNLSSLKKEILTLYAFENKTQVKIAKKLEISQAAVAKHIRNIKNLIKDLK
ncbi:hypothetical protein NE604_00780 [Anaerofustis stercorihominis]|uniref:sigma factor-like helix-turn-helix DNA-binding protein n=1 Tax=Anaerofustis stercorihominis TaxID=214853 RepID=UPI0021096ED8|nr:sigma factor-like helix-turn-helix DNA-binding protein [Anaerofustis stercorihominis]MCQ4794178.1 hypothetical protein [Anaerofustis stercorihominis]